MTDPPSTKHRHIHRLCIFTGRQETANHAPVQAAALHGRHVVAVHRLQGSTEQCGVICDRPMKRFTCSTKLTNCDAAQPIYRLCVYRLDKRQPLMRLLNQLFANAHNFFGIKGQKLLMVSAAPARASCRSCPQAPGQHQQLRTGNKHSKQHTAGSKHSWCPY
jgi:hypothetical protein